MSEELPKITIRDEAAAIQASAEQHAEKIGLKSPPRELYQAYSDNLDNLRRHDPKLADEVIRTTLDELDLQAAMTTALGSDAYPRVEKRIQALVNDVIEEARELPQPVKETEASKKMRFLEAVKSKVMTDPTMTEIFSGHDELRDKLLALFLKALSLA